METDKLQIIKQIRAHLRISKLSKAIELLRWFEEDSLLLEQTFSRIEEEKINGTLIGDGYNSELAKLSERILLFCQQQEAFIQQQIDQQLKQELSALQTQTYLGSDPLIKALEATLNKMNQETDKYLQQAAKTNKLVTYIYLEARVSVIGKSLDRLAQYRSENFRLLNSAIQLIGDLKKELVDLKQILAASQLTRSRCYAFTKNALNISESCLSLFIKAHLKNSPINISTVQNLEFILQDLNQLLYEIMEKAQKNT